ncbi:GNAT family N-acetyltransferase [Phenylobacterium sp.]|jgi:predicted acetyltransferase|uniref:GNAT family N-acetyltransferase n=1 Tax=Phenylobacterium sp. TaxID=1871053 RepID=UPI002F3FAA97
MPNVELERVGRERRQTLTNLFQLYCHDFSEQWFDRPEGELDEDGRLQEYSLLDNYWTQPKHEAMLIRADGRLAGFALVNDFSHSGLPLDFQIAEFFVARKHRRSRIGEAAALAIIRARPGQWELAVARRNIGAQYFWRRVAASIAGNNVEERDQDDERWNGLILRFRS